MAELKFHRVLSKDATVYDTLEAIVSTINEYKHSEFCRKAAKEFGPAGDKLVYIKRVYDWICSNIQYKEDFPGLETIFTPQLTTLFRKADCKKHTILFASIIAAAGIEPVLKHVYYAGRTDISHIYSIVPMPDIEHYVCCDTTLCKFGAEVDYKSATLYFLNGECMELHRMGSIHFEGGGTFHEAKLFEGEETTNPNRQANQDFQGQMHDAAVSYTNELAMCGSLTIGAIIPASHKERMQQLLPKHPGLQEHLHNIPIQDQRGAFLELIQKNVNGLATHLAAVLGTNPHALDNVWHIVGGDINHLKEQVIKAATLPPEREETKVSGWFKHLLHAAAGVLRAVAPIANVIIPGAGAAISGLADKADTIANAAPVRDAKGNLQPPPPNITPDPTGDKSHTDDHDHGGGKIFGMPAPLALGAGALVLLLLMKK